MMQHHPMRVFSIEQLHLSSESPKGVKRVGLTMRRSLPDFTCERTSAAPVGMYQKCQLQTHAPQQMACLLDSPHQLGQVARAAR
jgi:hypothetical protein